MLAVLLVVHIIACVALVVAVMLQRSEGGALGMGGGGTGGIISGRGVANVLVRTTMGLAAVFFVTSVIMTRLNTEAARAPNAVEKELKNRKTDAFAPTKEPTSAPATGLPGAPADTTTATPEPAAPAPDPLAAPSLTSPSVTATPANPAKPGAAAPVAPATKPASPDTAPVTPAPAGNGTNGQ